MWQTLVIECLQLMLSLPANYVILYHNILRKNIENL